MDVDILVTGGTGVAFGDLAGMFLMVVVPLALDEALGFKVMVNLNLNVLSAFAGLLVPFLDVPRKFDENCSAFICTIL